MFISTSTVASATQRFFFLLTKWKITALFLKRALSEVGFTVLIHVWAFEMLAPLIRCDKLLIQWLHCPQTRTTHRSFGF